MLQCSSFVKSLLKGFCFQNRSLQNKLGAVAFRSHITKQRECDAEITETDCGQNSTATPQIIVSILRDGGGNHKSMFPPINYSNFTHVFSLSSLR